MAFYFNRNLYQAGSNWNVENQITSTYVLQKNFKKLKNYTRTY
jgi:hypothetical protein